MQVMVIDVGGNMHQLKLLPSRCRACGTYAAKAAAMKMGAVKPAARRPARAAKIA